jgi:thymidylate synthase
LHFIVYFRSNDLWNGFPANLAAIRMMQEYMAECIGVEPGEIVYSSKGLHIYDHAWNVALLRTGAQEQESSPRHGE